MPRCRWYWYVHISSGGGFRAHYTTFVPCADAAVPVAWAAEPRAGPATDASSVPYGGRLRHETHDRAASLEVAPCDTVSGAGPGSGARTPRSSVLGTGTQGISWADLIGAAEDGTMTQATDFDPVPPTVDHSHPLAAVAGFYKDVLGQVPGATSNAAELMHSINQVGAWGCAWCNEAVLTRQC